MANTLAQRTLGGACFLLLAMAVIGCQSGPAPQMVEHTANPTVEPPASPARPPVAVTPPKNAPRQQAAPLAPSQPPVPSMVGIPRDWAPIVAPRRWEWIVIHHSATPVGGAARFGREHQAKGWDELGYHFVIGNGSDTANGLVEVGSRWPKQKQGAHTKTPDNNFNEKGIGICLVGDFDVARPTEAQLRAVAKLTAYLMKTYRIPADHIIGHCDAKATHCPGKNLRIAQLRSMSIQALAAAGQTPPPARLAAATPGKELLVDTRRAVR